MPVYVLWFKGINNWCGLAEAIDVFSTSGFAQIDKIFRTMKPGREHPGEGSEGLRAGNATLCMYVSFKCVC